MYNSYDKEYFNKLAKGIRVKYMLRRIPETGFIIGHWYEDREYPEYWIRENINKKAAEYEISYSEAYRSWTSVRYSRESFLKRMENDPDTKLFPKLDRFYGPLRPALLSFFEKIRKGMVYGIDEKDDNCKRWVLLFLLCFHRLLPDVIFPLEMVFLIGGYLRYPSIRSKKKKDKRRRIKKHGLR